MVGAGVGVLPKSPLLVSPLSDAPVPAPQLPFVARAAAAYASVPYDDPSIAPVLDLTIQTTPLLVAPVPISTQAFAPQCCPPDATPDASPDAAPVFAPLPTITLPTSPVPTAPEPFAA